MIHTISERIADFLFDNNDTYPIDVYVYGIELTVSSIIGTTVLLTAGLIFNCLIESIIYLISLSAIRMFSGGYHAKTYLRCNMVLIVTYICSLLFYSFYIKNLTQFNYIVLGFLLIFSTIIFILFAPVPNANKNEIENKTKYKIISIVLTISELMLAQIIYEFTEFYQVLIVYPTILVIDISILVEIIFQKRRVQNEKIKSNVKKSS